MKRLLILTVIIIMIFGLSSCQLADWFLGVMYPEVGDRTISVSVGVDSYMLQEGHAVVIMLVPIFVTDETTGKWDIDKTMIIREKFWNQDVINWDFSGLSINKYRVVAYYDYNDSGEIDATEPALSVPIKDTTQFTFDFTQDESITNLIGSGHLDYSSTIDETLMSKLTGSTAANSTTYDLQLYISSNYWFPNGYCTVSLRDAVYDNELMYNWIYLDGNGVGYVYFWGIVDPVGADQKVVVAFYDSNNIYQDERQLTLSGAISGYQTYSIYY